MNLLNIIEEHSIVQFSGRVNVLLKKNKQFVGAILVENGVVVSANYSGRNGKRALYALLIETENNSDFLLVSEPEVIDSTHEVFRIKIENIKKELSELKEKYGKSKELRPPDNIKMVVNPGFINSGVNINKHEFEVLKLISDYNKVEDIYKRLPYYEFEITNFLVSLKKKNAILINNQ